MLSHFGYEVIGAADGAEAARIYKDCRASDTPIDLVIMDLTIPGGMGGLEAVKELAGIDPEVRAVVASGYSNDPVVANFADYGFRAALAKPFQLKDLLAVVQSLLTP
jgi:CheY-like chemotaxis protein